MEASRAIRSSKRSRYRSLGWFLRGPSCPKVTLEARVSTSKLVVKGVVASGALSGGSFRLIISVVIDIKPSVG